MNRKLTFYIGLLLSTIMCGLLSRSSLIKLPVILSVYSGDTLWGMMVFWLFCCIRPRANTLIVAVLAITFSFGIEFSQLYHAPWIDAIRGFRLGGLVLGFGFKYSDLVCYSIGIVLGVGIDLYLSGQGSKNELE